MRGHAKDLSINPCRGNNNNRNVDSLSSLCHLLTLDSLNRSILPP